MLGRRNLTRLICAALGFLCAIAIAQAQIVSPKIKAGVPPGVPLRHDGQTFYPNTYALGATDPQDPGATYIASRMAMMSGSCTATALKLGFTNSAINQIDIGETTTALQNTNPTPLTTGSYAAYIEIAGAVTQVTFASGTATSATVVATAGITWSDTITINVPPQTSYAIQTLINASGPVGAVRLNYVSNPMPTGSGSELATSQPADFGKVYGSGGAWQGSNLTFGAAIVMPLIVAATTTSSTCNSVMIKGDSHVTGQTDNGIGDPGDANGFVGFPMRALDEFSNVPPFLCACIGSNKIASYGAPSSGTNAVEKAALSYFSNVMLYDIGNDVAGTETATQIEGYASTFIDNGFTAGVKAAFVWIMPPQTTSGDNKWDNYTQQAVFRNTGPASKGATMTSWIEAGVTNGGNAMITVDHVTGTGGIGGACSAGSGLSGTGDTYFWCANGTPFYATQLGEHPDATLMNSYNVGALQGYTLDINPGSTAYGLLQ